MGKGGHGWSCMHACIRAGVLRYFSSEFEPLFFRFHFWRHVLMHCEENACEEADRKARACTRGMLFMCVHLFMRTCSNVSLFFVCQMHVWERVRGWCWWMTVEYVYCVCVNGWVGGWYVHMQRSESSVCFCLTQRGRYTMQTQAERGGECIGEEMDALTHTHLNTQLVQWAISQMEASNGTLWLNKTSARIESHLMCLLWICFFIEEFTWNQIWSYILSYYTFLGVCVKGGWYDQNQLKNSTCI